MNKLSNTLFLLFGLFISACSSDQEPEAITPVRFEQSAYTIRWGRGSYIPFTGGSGLYELRAGDPDVLGKFGIDTQVPARLFIQPAKTGVSTLTVTDTQTAYAVTLHITVVDFYLSFKIDAIAGENANPYLQVGDEIRFVRDAANSKPIQILRDANQSAAAYGRFDILHSGTNRYTMRMDLHSHENEQFETFEYTMGGDGEYMTIFDNYFGFDWDERMAASSSAPPARRIEMILTGHSDDCEITCVLQP